MSTVFSPPTFSLLDGTLPCVLIDSEPKVVQSCCKTGALAERVHPMSQLFEKSGRGNNWAYGYYGKTIAMGSHATHV